MHHIFHVNISFEILNLLCFEILIWINAKCLEFAQIFVQS